MGLGQVRSLRRSAVAAIIAARPFANLDKLLAHVDLQQKEIVHLIQCGALDGLGASRVAMLETIAGRVQSGSVHQLAFDFGEVATEIPAETPYERLQWETKILGQPVSTHPLDACQFDAANLAPLRELSQHPGQHIRAIAVRLPGWTGGKGFYVGDQTTFVEARLDGGEPKPKAWQPVVLTGRWRVDTWGGEWLQVETIEEIE